MTALPGHQVNLSEIGVVTPKALSFRKAETGEISLWVSGFGGDRLAEFRLGNNGRPGLQRTFRAIPGISDFVTGPTGLTLVSPLLDRVEKRDFATPAPLVSAYLGLYEPPDRAEGRRIGELVFFTTLMTPGNSSRGPLSRFTCEACHFEGGTDGRVHYTGRADIHASSKTLYGLANNVPLFSRGGDADLSSMVLAEFEVANQGRQDEFSVSDRDFPWLRHVSGTRSRTGPEELRRALLAFFTDFEHRPNPRRLRDKALPSAARRGLDVFRRRCEDCHQAVRSTRGGTAEPFSEWASWLEGEKGDLVWGAPFFSKTGIEPYVDQSGTRVPSLRRVQMKYPYFTNGSSRDLQHLLGRFRYQGTQAWHHFDPKEDVDVGEVRALTPMEISDLLQLLRYF